MVDQAAAAVDTERFKQATPKQGGGHANEQDPSWEDVITMVVIPANPDGARNAATEWDQMFALLAQIQLDLHDGIGDLETWKGSGGEAFRDYLTKVSKTLEGLVDEHRNLTRLLRDAAGNVENAAHSIAVPDDMFYEVTTARENYVATGKLVPMQRGAIYDKLFAIYSTKWADGLLELPGVDWATRKLRDWISHKDNDAIRIYHELAHKHVDTMVAMPGPTQDVVPTPGPNGDANPLGPTTGPTAGPLPTGAGPPTGELPRTTPYPSGKDAPTNSGGPWSGTGDGPAAGAPGSGRLPGGGDLSRTGGLSGAGGPQDAGGFSGPGGLRDGGGFSGIGGLQDGGGAFPPGSTDLSGTSLAGAGDGLVGADPRGTGFGSGVGPGSDGLGGAGTGQGATGLARGSGPSAGGVGGMHPMGAGGGAGGARPGSGDEHTSWLQEDEDVWGADNDAPPSVLG